MNLEDYYQKAVTTPHNIYEHIPIFREYTKNLDGESITIAEIGIETIVSSWGFAMGLKDNSAKNKMLIGVDLNYHPNIEKLKQTCKEEKIDYIFMMGNSIKVELPSVDILFIDSWHVYGHLKRELNRHHKQTKKYIMMHDTTIDGEVGESIRMNYDIEYQITQSGYSREEIIKGIWPAVEEFLLEHPEWILKERKSNNNGLTILERV